MRFLKNILSPLLFLTTFNSCNAQTQSYNINDESVRKSIEILAADSLKGRNALVKDDIEKAEKFISSTFQQLGLTFFSNLKSYHQPFIYEKDGVSHTLNNIVGVLEGKSLKHEIIIFSAHYDHIGIIDAIDKDSIANGANDDASGVAAVLELAKHFSTLKNNERTLVFVAFTAEELGGFGSKHFSEQINTKNTVAMFNIEMIGGPSKFGENSAFITGYNLSNFGEILNKNLAKNSFKFYPDPYLEQNLFYRSDNTSLAKLGIPAHTISSVQIDKDTLYHTVHDEIKHLDIKNITTIIKAIAKSSNSIISGEDTPTRISLKK